MRNEFISVTVTFSLFFSVVLSEWWGPVEFPPLIYFSEAALLSWCWQAEWLEEALGGLREHIGPQLHRLSRETQGRMLGECLGSRRVHNSHLVFYVS